MENKQMSSLIRQVAAGDINALDEIFYIYQTLWTLKPMFAAEAISHPYCHLCPSVNAG